MATMTKPNARPKSKIDQSLLPGIHLNGLSTHGRRLQKRRAEARRIQ
jgi:hypothetical protein